jgi:hypothetical protein
MDWASSSVKSTTSMFSSFVGLALRSSFFTPDHKREYKKTAAQAINKVHPPCFLFRTSMSSFEPQCFLVTGVGEAQASKNAMSSLILNCERGRHRCTHEFYGRIAMRAYLVHRATHSRQFPRRVRRGKGVASPSRGVCC